MAVSLLFEPGKREHGARRRQSSRVRTTARGGRRLDALPEHGASDHGERDPGLRAQHLDRAEAPEAPRAYLDAALAQAAALQPERALALAERGAALAKGPDDVVALNMLRGRLRRESGAGPAWPDVSGEVARIARERRDGS